MSGSNLPPGVGEHMIPGNRPEDALEEKFWEKLAEGLIAANMDPGDLDNLLDDEKAVKAINVARDLSYSLGFGDGRMEEQMAQAAKAEEAWEESRGQAPVQSFMAVDWTGHELVVGDTVIYGDSDLDNDEEMQQAMAVVESIAPDLACHEGQMGEEIYERILAVTIRLKVSGEVIELTAHLDAHHSQEHEDNAYEVEDVERLEVEA